MRAEDSVVHDAACRVVNLAADCIGGEFQTTFVIRDDGRMVPEWWNLFKALGREVDPELNPGEPGEEAVQEESPRVHGFYTVRGLRCALEGLDDNREIICQVASTDGQAWMMQATFVRHLTWGDGQRSLISFEHPELTTLPDLRGGGFSGVEGLSTRLREIANLLDVGFPNTYQDNNVPVTGTNLGDEENP